MDGSQSQTTTERENYKHRLSLFNRCKAQYKNSSIFWHISTLWKSRGINASQEFFCSCHGKGECDSTGGTIKGILDHQESLASTDDTIDAKFRNSKDCCDFLSQEAHEPKKNIFSKSLSKVFKRNYYHPFKWSRQCQPSNM